MQVADVGLKFRDNLAVSPQNESQHAMGTGVLGPHVDEHLIGTNIELDDSLVVFNHLRHDLLPLASTVD
jgi:hypothetical protein